MCDADIEKPQKGTCPFRCCPQGDVAVTTLRSSKRPCRTWLCRVPRRPLAALGLPHVGTGPPTVGFRHTPRDPQGRRVTCLLCSRPEPGAFAPTSQLCEPCGAASARGPEPRASPSRNKTPFARDSVRCLEFRRLPEGILDPDHGEGTCSCARMPKRNFRGKKVFLIDQNRENPKSSQRDSVRPP